MHRLMREKWKRFGEGRGQLRRWRAFFVRREQNQGLQKTSEKGKVMTWEVSRGLVDGGRDSGLAPAGAGSSRGASQPLLWPGGASFSCAHEGEPQAQGQTHFALTPLCKHLGVLSAVLLPQRALPTSNFPAHVTQ